MTAHAPVHRIRDTIELAISVSARSGVPVLLLGNPGLAKSTVVGNWAARNGFHLETLIGSRYSQEEILGFQARVKDRTSGAARLELLEPYWFRNIAEHDERGTPTLLFLDELSAVPENVQGAMLQLVFGRTIGHGKTLPASTLIVSAANYKENLPFGFNIMAPILNRFCLVNIGAGEPSGFFAEFLQAESERSLGVTEYADIPVSEGTAARLRDGLQTMWKAVFADFNKTDAAPLLDLDNQALGGIYEAGTGRVDNFISGRTAHYLYRVTAAFLGMGLSVERHGAMMLNLVLGLVGLGTNSMGEPKLHEYRRTLGRLWTQLYEALAEELAGGGGSGEPVDFAGKSVAEAVNEWTLLKAASIFTNRAEKSLPALLRHIRERYPAVGGDTRVGDARVDELKRRIAVDDAALFGFAGDMRKIDALIDTLTAESPAPPSYADALDTLTGIRAAYAALREAALNKAINGETF
jgi:hypothetical protein